LRAVLKTVGAWKGHGAIEQRLVALDWDALAAAYSP
jgi:hypothetical protein